MPRLTIQEAKRQGYTVDTTCYPHLGYKDERFDPTETVEVLTRNESDLLSVAEDLLSLLKAYSDLSIIDTKGHDVLLALINRVRGTGAGQ